MTQLGDLVSSATFFRWLKYIQLIERQIKNIFFCHKDGARFIFYAKCIKWWSMLILELGQSQFMPVDVLTRHEELCRAKVVRALQFMHWWEPGVSLFKCRVSCHWFVFPAKRYQSCSSWLSARKNLRGAKDSGPLFLNQWAIVPIVLSIVFWKF